MRAPHARRLRELGLEETMLLRLVLRRRRNFAVARIVEHVAELLGDVLLHGEQIADAALLTRFRIRESERALPRFVGHIQLVQRMDQRVAAGERHGDEIGLQLHLARQRALRQHDDAEHRLHQRADRPHDEREQPADPGDTQVEARQAAQERIERIALRDDVTGNLLGDVDPAADRHRTLTEVTELVREHRLQLAERDGVDETGPQSLLSPDRVDRPMVDERRKKVRNGPEPGRRPRAPARGPGRRRARRPGPAALPREPVGEAVGGGRVAAVELVEGPAVPTESCRCSSRSSRSPSARSRRADATIGPSGAMRVVLYARPGCHLCDVGPRDGPPVRERLAVRASRRSTSRATTRSTRVRDPHPGGGGRRPGGVRGRGRRRRAAGLVRVRTRQPAAREYVNGSNRLGSPHGHRPGRS